MKLIITADDFGMSPSTNVAIAEGVQKGIITSTNIMVNLPWADEALPLKAKYEGLSVGLHWNLTTGKPVSPPDRVQSLIDLDGQFWTYHTLKNKLRKRKIRMDEVERELLAQAELFFGSFGKPEYWNTHNHFQMLPEFFFHLVSIAKKLDFLCMRNNHKICSRMESPSDRYKNILIDAMYKYARGNQMVYPNGLLCFYPKEDKLNEGAYQNLARRGEGPFELMLHIASDCDSEYFGSLKEQRIEEYRFFVRDDFKKMLKENQIQLCNFWGRPVI